MRTVLDNKRINASRIAAWLIPASSFWLVLAFKIPYSFTRYFHRYVLIVFLIVLLLYYLSFRLRGNVGIFAGLGLTMLLVSLTLSYMWTSGYSDNFVIGGLLPYKDAKNYYLGANLILNGFPIRYAGQAVERPLFPGFLSSLLLLTGQSLKITQALLAQLAGLGLYLSVRPIRKVMGALPASLYMAYMYFYLQPNIGFTISELLGFTAGCLAFALLWYVTQNRKWFDLLLGLIVLLVAVSARAGAFLIFPLLALWVGLLFRGTKRFSFVAVAGVLVAIVLGYLAINSVYPRLLGVPEGSSFSNFAYALYGQVRGGIGWHSAINELGSRNPSLVYQATLDYFLAHPLDYAVGIAKAYRDFFSPGLNSIFMFGGNVSWYAFDLVLWGLTIALIVRGLFLLISRARNNLSSLLLAGFLGILVSIPFLPPIDGGMRFYASTMPFFFVLPAIGSSRSFLNDDLPAENQTDSHFLVFASIILLVLIVLLPPVVLRTSGNAEYALPDCPSDQRPFAIRVNPGSYIDLVQNGKSACGLIPKVCFDDFLSNNTELGKDDFYKELNLQASFSNANVRIIPTINLSGGAFQYYLASNAEVLQGSSGKILLGCATRISTENQRIFKIESFQVADR